MSRFAKLFAANTIAAAGLGAAAVAMSPAAIADPVIPPAIPDVPALNMLQQFATNPASVGAVLQTAATALNGASSVVGGAPATLPISPIEGVPGAPAVAVPVAPAAAPMGLGSTLVPLLNQLGVPASLANLTPAAAPATVPAAVPAAVPLTGTAPAAVVMPLSALP